MGTRAKCLAVNLVQSRPLTTAVLRSAPSHPIPELGIFSGIISPPKSKLKTGTFQTPPANCSHLRQSSCCIVLKSSTCQLHYELPESRPVL